MDLKFTLVYSSKDPLDINQSIIATKLSRLIHEKEKAISFEDYEKVYQIRNQEKELIELNFNIKVLSSRIANNHIYYFVTV